MRLTQSRSDELNALLLIALDAASLLIAYELTVRLRITFNEFFDSQFTPHTSYLLMPPFLFMLGLTILAFFIVGLYDRSHRSFPEILGRVARGITLAIMLILVASFFLSRDLYSRSLIATLWLVGFVTVSLARGVAGFSLARLRRYGVWTERVAIVGNGQRAERVAERLFFPGSDFRIEGVILPSESAPSHAASLDALGPVEELESIINERHLDRILLSDEAISEADITRIAGICERMGVQFDKTADLFGAVPRRIWIVNGLPLVSIVSAELSRWDQIVKRMLDLSLSLVLVTMLLPLFTLIALAIRLESPGPVLFRQVRRGRGGRYFAMLKFRSMRTDAEEKRRELSGLNETDGALFKIRNDPRVTRVGRILRKFSLDELPQLFNVLRGEMSFVGPRPLPVTDIESNLDDPSFRYWVEKRESVLPGITGLWQVRGRSELGFREMLTLDVYYIKNWSLVLDLVILMRTVPVVLAGRGAY